MCIHIETVANKHTSLFRVEFFSSPESTVAHQHAYNH